METTLPVFAEQQKNIAFSALQDYFPNLLN